MGDIISDIICYIRIADEHSGHFNQVLEMLEGCGLKAHLDNIAIRANIVKSLGHNVAKFSQLRGEAKVAAVRNLNPPMCMSCVACLDP